MLVALPAAVAGPRPALLARPQEVVHVVGEDAVLDEHVALGEGALVVDGEGSPLLGHGAVVDQRDPRVGHPLADAAGEHRRALGHQVGLETVAAGLVEQHPAAPGPDHHRHGARRRRPGGQLQQRPLGGLAGDVVDVVGVEQLEADRAAQRLVAGLHAGVARGHRHHGEERAHLVVFGEEPVAVGDEDPPAAVAVARRHLGDRGTGPAGGGVRPAQEVDLGGLGHVLGEDRDVVGPGRVLPREGHFDDPAASRASRRTGRLGGRGQPLRGQVGRVGEPCGVADDHADPGPTVAAGAEVLHLAVVEDGVRAGLVLYEDLGELAARAERRRQGALDDVVVEHGAPLGWLARVRRIVPRCL